MNKQIIEEKIRPPVRSEVFGPTFAAVANKTRWQIGRALLYQVWEQRVVQRKYEV